LGARSDAVVGLHRPKSTWELGLEREGSEMEVVEVDDRCARSVRYTVQPESAVPVT
jgi:hypothetical protein